MDRLKALVAKKDDKILDVLREKQQLEAFKLENEAVGKKAVDVLYQAKEVTARHVAASRRELEELKAQCEGETTR